MIELDGVRVLFGNTFQDNTFNPTMIHVPLKYLEDSKYDYLFKEEMFAPITFVTIYDHTCEKDINRVIDICNSMNEFLTAAIVSDNKTFIDKITSETINGTTYVGTRARTTGAPQNHWFGPSGDPRSTGIGSPEAIVNTWSCHREIINDGI